ncbi:PREDICTED: receptor-type guanylate cyclase gcy-1-like [Priapulus caudatus]|uniref:Guanylate cyclase n=1 Tax=Priapulus caudatus TaxID=37621 RepID=A0ABM1EJZ6_PRICU|nr:PREDICTED: receptor-type guanylate cyclase gcy-1-like [Priapulus caudatus]
MCVIDNLVSLPLPLEDIDKGVAVVFNLGREWNTNLNLSREVLVGIFNGTYLRWNNPSIQSINPTVIMPEKDILVVVRADDSGTTGIFTHALSAFSPHWNTTFGKFSEGQNKDDVSRWNDSVISYYGTKSLGVTGIVMSIVGTITYVSLADALEASQGAQLPMAAIASRQFNFVFPTLESVQLAAEYYSDSFDKHFTTDLVDPGTADAYPISGYTYFIIRMDTDTKCDACKELIRYIDWFMNDESARTLASDLGLTPLGERVRSAVHDHVLSRVSCGGAVMWELVQADRHWEVVQQQKWRVPVFVLVPLIAATVIAMAVYLGHVYVRTNRALMRSEWRIPPEDIQPINTFVSLISQRVLGDGTPVSSSGSLRQPERATPFVVALYRDERVFLRPTSVKLAASLSKEARRTLIWFKDGVTHVNVMRFYGATVQADEYRLVSECCAKGALADVLRSQRYNLDAPFLFSLAADVAAGMAYLHGIGIVHGMLRPQVCFIDIRWNVKVADWEYARWNAALRRGARRRDAVYPQQNDDEARSQLTSERHLLYHSPERLVAAQRGSLHALAKPDDVYSYGILAYEIFMRGDAYDDVGSTMSLQDIVAAVGARYLRPAYAKHIPRNVFYVVESCWHDQASTRPTFSHIGKRLKACNPTKKSLLDNMMLALEEYTLQLEEKVAERTAELAQVTSNMEKLLGSMLPPEIAAKLSSGRQVEPEYFEDVSVFFSDIVGFTSLSAASSPLQVVNLLNHVYTHFDSIIENHDVYKVETIGDAYMVISGLPRRTRHHAAHIANMALEFVARRVCVPHVPEQDVVLRCGVASGSVMAGVVGLKMPRYCLFGDTVNTASRMESTSLPSRIQITAATHAHLTLRGGYVTSPRGEVEIKGKGTMKTYWLEGKLSDGGVRELSLESIAEKSI